MSDANDNSPRILILETDRRIAVALIDFGISKSASLAGADGEVISGTPYYMSPEQANSEPTDERTDLYALGVVVYQMLTGQKPYAGVDTEEILRGHREAAVPRLPERLAAFQHLISRLLAKRPDDRIASARELVGIIEHQLTKELDEDYALSASSA